MNEDDELDAISPEQIDTILLRAIEDFRTTAELLRRVNQAQSQGDEEE